jgi:hypothetical protein
MTSCLVLTTLVDAALVAASCGSCGAPTGRRSSGLATQHAAMARLRAELADSWPTPSGGRRALDHVPGDARGDPPGARPDLRAARRARRREPATSPAEVRLLRDLELSLEPARPGATAASGS